MLSAHSITSSFSGMSVATVMGALVVLVRVAAGAGATFVGGSAALVPRPLVTDAVMFVAPGGFGTGGNQMPTSHCHKNSAPKDATRRRTVFRSMKIFAARSSRLGQNAFPAPGHSHTVPTDGTCTAAEPSASPRAPRHDVARLRTHTPSKWVQSGIRQSARPMCAGQGRPRICKRAAHPSQSIAPPS